MHKRTQFSLFVPLVLLLLSLSGCAPRAGAGTMLTEDSALKVDLSAMVIDIDGEGIPHLSDLPLSQIVEPFAPGLLDNAILPSDQVRFLTASNIQHIQISNHPNGPLLFVNGEPIPSLKWDEASLANAFDTLALFDVDLPPELEEMLPLALQFGVGVATRFPLAEGEAEIPFVVEKRPTLVEAKASQNAFLDAVERPPIFRVPIFYDINGNWTINGLTQDEWASLSGIPPNILRLPTELIQELTERGITEVSLSTNRAGIFLSLNEKKLPHIGWADGEFEHLIKLIGQTGLVDRATGSSLNTAILLDGITQTLPGFQAIDAKITIYLPN